MNLLGNFFAREFELDFEWTPIGEYIVLREVVRAIPDEIRQWADGAWQMP